MFFASLCQLLAALPEIERSIEIEPTLLQLLHDGNQFIPGLFIAQFTNRLNTHDARTFYSLPSLTAAMTPSDTRTRRRVPSGASA
ncbi:hypothetical protein A5669_28350 [Mycolicibacterium fortuitum]|nr:hypothetical protein A5669_28350 [Mycolicibacterium fortuitum]